MSNHKLKWTSKSKWSSSVEKKSVEGKIKDEVKHPLKSESEMGYRVKCEQLH